jgi:Zn finger protein HypA/HybF involved in hydrogenase expression
MHELSVAMGIVNITEKEIKKANKNKVTLIELEIGLKENALINLNQVLLQFSTNFMKQ